MSIVETIKGWWHRMFKDEIKKEFGVTGVESQDMRNAISSWMDIYTGKPVWALRDDGIHTIKFAKFICSEMASLACLDIDVAFDGRRKEGMSEFWRNAVSPRVQHWLEYGLAAGSFILKPNGEGIDYVTPDRFQITATDGNGRITGAVFQDNYTENGKFYTKLEYHSFWTAKVRMKNSDEYISTTYYKIQNKAFMSKNQGAIGSEISLEDTIWNKLEPETYITRADDGKLNGMLFGFFKVPYANDIDMNSPLGVSVFHNAIKELEDLDVAYSRNSEEIYDSARMVLLDDRLTDSRYVGADNKSRRVKVPMPHYIKNMTNDNPENFYQEINPTLNTTIRQEGIDNLLSLIGTKCGFSNGYFVLDQKTGMVTATQVEADDRGTIQTIKSIRDALKVCLEELFYAQSVFMDLYNLAPVGDYEPTFNWGDLTYNFEEDKQTWWKYVQMNKVPFWVYLTKFEGMSEEEAKAMASEAEEANKDKGLFGEE